jgi:DNA-binding FrmR family transcriptional regulator
MDTAVDATSDHGGHRSPGYADDKQQVLARLRRIEGQVRGLQRMVEEEQYCIDVLTQVAAVTKALQGVGLLLLDEHLQHCVAGAASHGERTEGLVHEATKAVERLLRA